MMTLRGRGRLLAVSLLAGAVVAHGARGEEEQVAAQDPIGAAVSNYFYQCFNDLKTVADTKPTSATFRKEMKPVAQKTKGLFGGTLIDTNYVIKEVYYKRDALARGYDLKKVKELDVFWKKMSEKPEPQLSEPGHGNLIQPRLVAMRYPFLGTDGELEGIVSMMIRTEAFLKETGLDKCKAFQIIVDEKVREEDGKLSASPKEVTLALPSTTWTIKYDR